MVYIWLNWYTVKDISLFGSLFIAFNKKVSMFSSKYYILSIVLSAFTNVHSYPYNYKLCLTSTIAKKPDKLKAIGITHVLNCACGSTFNMVNTDQEFFESSGILFHGIPAVDVWKFKMAPYFSAAADFIEQALNSKGLY